MHADGAYRRNMEEQIRASLSKLGFEGATQAFLVDGAGLALSEGPELFNDGKVIVAFCGELTNKEQLVRKVLLKDEAADVEKIIGEKNVSARLVGKLFEEAGQQPQSIMGKLRGTYGFIVLDIATVRVFAARDCSGLIPLYQNRLSNGTLVVSNFEVEECNQQTEVPPGHYVYGGRRCSFPQKFSDSKEEWDKAQGNAHGAVSKALQGILTRAQLTHRPRSSPIKAPTRKPVTLAENPSVKREATSSPSPPLITVLSQSFHEATTPQRKRQHRHSAVSKGSNWWRTPEPKPVSVAAAPFVHSSVKPNTPVKQKVEESSPPAVVATPTRLQHHGYHSRGYNTTIEEERLSELHLLKVVQQGRIIEAVKALHRIASSDKIKSLLKVQQEEATAEMQLSWLYRCSSKGMRRVLSCSEMDTVNHMPKLKVDLASLIFN